MDNLTLSDLLWSKMRKTCFDGAGRSGWIGVDDHCKEKSEIASPLDPLISRVASLIYLLEVVKSMLIGSAVKTVMTSLLKSPPSLL